MTTSENPNVLLVVEQLRRSVPGGSGTYASGVIQGLRTLSEKKVAAPPVTLFASRYRGVDPQRFGPTVDTLAWFGMPFKTSRLPAPFVTRAWDAGVLHAPRGFTIIHGTTLAVPKARRARTYVTLHDLAWRQLPFAYTERGRKWHERAFLRSLEARHGFVVSSDAVGDQLREAGVADNSVTVIAPGSDHLPEPDATIADRILQHLGVSGPFMLSVGTLEPRKNLDALIEAYSMVRDALPAPWTLVVVGPRGWGPGVTPREGVVLAGSVSEYELSALYSRAVLLGYVPLLEGFGLPPLEAMQAGLPVLASPVPSIGGAGFEVDPRNTPQIAEGLLAVATDEPLRQKLIDAGRARAAALSWEACAMRHVELWQSGE